ncbi:hypothetical protein L198_01976 [Cryptococcus wingfieldii CBS 7118]|uniref:Uncharacterized protein n=1 Tax=Cryptococcus wingfieldii CBS 7118 TaxID=1295528 RepID=A0A1E3JWQ3_9TREE|nr:hypothetical protein L198_01976 [Cryptococcus wingfieldii CBS 7118]ODO05284.1 hypothetical protein L198_01976 [Cryptococcus wingfieldii CBS 7118]
MPPSFPHAASVIDLLGDVFFTSQTPQEFMALYSAYAPGNPASHLQRYAPQHPPTPSSPSHPRSTTRLSRPRYSIATCSGFIDDKQRYYVFGLPTDPDVAWLRRQGWIVYDARWLVHSLKHGRTLPLAHWIISDAYLEQPIFLPARPETSQVSSPETLVNPSPPCVGLPSSAIPFGPRTPESPLPLKCLPCQQDFMTKPAVWSNERPLGSSPTEQGSAGAKRKLVNDREEVAKSYSEYDTGGVTPPSMPRSTVIYPHNTKPAPKRRKLGPITIIPSSPTPSPSSTTATYHNPAVIPLSLPKSKPSKRTVYPPSKGRARYHKTGARSKPSDPASPDVFSAPPITRGEKETECIMAEEDQGMATVSSDDSEWLKYQEKQGEGRESDEVPCFRYEDIVKTLERAKAKRMTDWCHDIAEPYLTS